MKVGDYVRTKYGISQCIKVIPIRENSFMYEFDKEVYEEVNYLTASELEKYKTSDEIINLIETEDYVNGHKVIFTIGNFHKRIYIEYVNANELLEIKLEQIKSIVTKEQFESMEYKVGE